MKKHLKYKYYTLIQKLGILLAYSYKIQGYKQNKYPKIKNLGYDLEDWFDFKIESWILKKYGPQNSWGWIGSPLDGLYIIDDKEDFNRITTKYLKKTLCPG